mgnify:CR=1 FL=1|jgi:uncharacterized protein YqeY|tara:strand:+ start:84 stop:545 length:462 start_codon:yes stop_codon:yes gene_type:complete
MSLKIQIEEMLNLALKAKDKNTYPALRLVMSTIKDAEIAKRAQHSKEELLNSEIMSLLKKMIKQRNDSCEAYKKAGREELVAAETKEIIIISKFLPKQLDEAEIKKMCEETIKLVGANSMKDMGKVMGELKRNSKADIIDLSKVSVIIKNILT